MNILSVKDISKLLGLSETTVRKLAREGILPAFFVGERRIYFDEQVLREFIESGGRKTAPLRFPVFPSNVKREKGE